MNKVRDVGDVCDEKAFNMSSVLYCQQGSSVLALTNASLDVAVRQSPSVQSIVNILAAYRWNTKVIRNSPMVAFQVDAFRTYPEDRYCK